MRTEDGQQECPALRRGQPVAHSRPERLDNKEARDERCCEDSEPLDGSDGHDAEQLRRHTGEGREWGVPLSFACALEGHAPLQG